MYGVPKSACICTSSDWRDCDDDCDACWGEECNYALEAERNLSEQRTEDDMDLIKRLEHFERGGTVENPKALIREAIAELQRLQRVETDANRRLCDD